MSVWHEIIVVGGEKRLRGFVAGFVGGRALDEAILLGSDIAVEPPTLTERLRDLVTSGARHTVLAPEVVAAQLVAALGRSGADVDLHVDGHSEVVSASFEVSAEAFSPEVAARVQAALGEMLPPGVSVEAFKEEETTDGGSRGAELYAPSHDYTYRAKGRITGELTGVVEMHRRAEALEFVTAEPITVEARGIAR